MEAVLYGAYCDEWLIQSKHAERRMREDRLTIRSRRAKEEQIERLTAQSEPQVAWEETLLMGEQRLKDEEAWAVDIKSQMAQGIDRCASTIDDTLYDRLEELHHTTSEINRHEKDRRAWHSYAERMAVLLPREQQEGALRKVELTRYTFRMYHEDAHEVRRKFEKAIVDRAIHHEIIDLPYKNLSQELRIYPRQGCQNYIKALRVATAQHEARQRGETVPENQIEEANHAQLDAITSTNSQTVALASNQLQNNWLLAEIRQRLRPDGRELIFETEAEQYKVIDKEEEEESEQIEESKEKSSRSNQPHMVYAKMEEERPDSPAKKKWFWCC